MKRVAFVVNTLSTGGAERVAANLSRMLSDRYSIDFILNDEENINYPYSGEVISLGMPGAADRMKAVYQIKALAKRTALLRRLKKEKNYVAVISFSDNTNLSNVLSRRKDINDIITISYSLIGWEVSRQRKSILRRVNMYLCCTLADTVVSCSKAINDDTAVICKRCKNKREVIYNGIEGSVFNVQSIGKDKISSYKSDDRKPHIVTVGRMSEVKAQHHLLYALKELKDRGFIAYLTILGEGKLRNQLEEISRDLGIQDQVFMPGWVKDVTAYLCDADAAVFTSDAEGFSNAIVEALACGVPCVSTDHKTGAREILAPDTDWNKTITDNLEYASYGILVPVCKEEKNGFALRAVSDKEKLLADAIYELVTNRDLSDRYRTAGLMRAKELSMETIAEQWAEVIEKSQVK